MYQNLESILCLSNARLPDRIQHIHFHEQGSMSWTVHTTKSSGKYTQRQQMAVRSYRWYRHRETTKKKKKKPHMEVKKTEPLTTFYTSDIRRQNGNRERRMLLSRIRYCLWPKLFIHCNTISVLSNHRVFIPSSKSNSCIWLHSPDKISLLYLKHCVRMYVLLHCVLRFKGKWCIALMRSEQETCRVRNTET